MRLFGVVDGSVDRQDRAEWLSPPFDKYFLRPPRAGLVGRISIQPRLDARVSVTPRLAANIEVRTRLEARMEPGSVQPIWH